MVMVKITILAMTILTFLSSNGHGHGQMVKINRYLYNFNNKKSGIVEMMMIKFGLTILAMTIL
jgi:hypothetical protein